MKDIVTPRDTQAHEKQAQANTQALAHELTHVEQAQAQTLTHVAQAQAQTLTHVAPPPEGGRRNAYLSYSRLSKYEQCPKAYEFSYVHKLRGEANDSLVLGKTVHYVCEHLVGEFMLDEREGRLSLDRANELLQEACKKEGLTSFALYQEAAQMVRDFVNTQGVLDGRNVLAVEKEFRLTVGPFTVLGFMDRVDFVDKETIEIIDYKSNRLLFDREDLDSSLQMSIYEVASRILWPWVKNVRLKFWMLRHNVMQTTSRTEQALKDALAYVELLGRQTEEAITFPARLNANCCYCDHRQRCDAYQDALKGKRLEVAADTNDLEAVAREREEVSKLAKIMYARKDELEDLLKAQLRDRDELVLSGVKYKVFVNHGSQHSLEHVCKVLAPALKMSEAEVASAVASVENKKLTALLSKASKSIGAAQVSMLKAELEAGAKQTHTARFWAKEL